MKSKLERTVNWGRELGCILIAVLVIGTWPAYVAEADTTDASAKPEVISFIVGESAIVQAPWPTVRVAVTDPTVANVQVLTPDQVLLQGTKVGSTDLIVWSEDEKEVQQWKVRVRMDTGNFEEKLDELFPDSTLQVNQSGEALVVTGLLRRAEQARQLHGFLDKSAVTYVDMTSVAGVQQVQLDVRVAEVSRAALRSLGVNAFRSDQDFFAVNRIGGITPISMGPALGSAEGQTSFIFDQGGPAPTSVTLMAGLPRADLEFFLAALAENQYLRLLANPTLVALSGEQASFLAGGEFPVPVPQTGGGAGTGGTSITIDYKEYGVRLMFRPVVLGDNTIRLTVVPEVSELSPVNAVEIYGYSVPTLLTRKAETTLELKSGETFAMAGLLSNKVEAINSRIPGLGDLPVLGPLFRSVSYQKNETELTVLVTASLVEPMALAAQPPVPGFLHADPNDWDLYVEGRLVGKRAAKVSSDDAKLLKQMGLDRLIGPGAWDSYGREVPSSQADMVSSPEAEVMGTQNSEEAENMMGTSPTEAGESLYPIEEKEAEN